MIAVLWDVIKLDYLADLFEARSHAVLYICLNAFAGPSMACLIRPGTSCLLLLLHVVTCLANSPPTLSHAVVPRKVAKYGKTTKLTCPVEQAEPDLTNWRKYGQALNPAWDRFKISKEGNLRIKHTKMEDAGNYTCVATNGYGSIHINYTVIVLDEENQIFQEGTDQFFHSKHDDLNRDSSPPFFEELDKMEESKVLVKPTGSSVRLKCAANGNPRPSISWLRNGRRLENREAHHTLKVADLRENASYTCVAENRLGQINFTYNVGVVGQIRAPRLTAPHPLNQTSGVGGKVQFQCFIESMVKPTVQWLKRVDSPNDNSNASINYEGQKYVVLKNAGLLHQKRDGFYLNKLVLPSVAARDAGTYVCTATNRMGFNARSAQLKIQKPGLDTKFQDTRFSGNYNPNSNSDMDQKYNDSSLSESSAESYTNLTLIVSIASTAGAVFILILLVFYCQKAKPCRNTQSSTKVIRPPVPTHERDAYYYSNCHQQQQTVNPLLNSREKLPKTPAPSVDMASSEYSSAASRTHPPPSHLYYHQNNHMNYGY